MEGKLLQKIIEQNNRREKSIMCEEACFSKDAIRFFPKREKIPDEKNIRQPFFHDTDRIMHSLSYTRYIDKTQVFSFFNNDNITHRVLHVQFVSKIARVIARSLKLNEDLIEAIALGHDIGHSPFGHTGEYFLNNLCSQNNIGTFMHNVQSVRNLMYLEGKAEGLNLTLQVLDGILTHNGEGLANNITPKYKKNKEEFMGEYEGLINGEVREDIASMTKEGVVVRFSDVIAYIGRDIEDAIMLGIIKRSDLPKEVAVLLGDKNDEIINNLALDLIEHSYNKPYIGFTDKIFEALVKLQSFNYKNIYLHQETEAEKNKLKDMFNKLFEYYLKELEENQIESKIYKYKMEKSEDYIKTTPNKRVVIDYMAGMTDNYFIRMYKEKFMPTYK